MAEQIEQVPNALTINGRFLQHYLRTMECMQDTFDQGDAGVLPFHKYVLYLRSIINDKKRCDQIDRNIQKERERVYSQQFRSENPGITDTQCEFLIGFKVVNGCMKYLGNTLNLNRQQSKDINDVNGLMLNHVLTTMERMQKTFSKGDIEGADAFVKYIHYLMSIITDDRKVREINERIAKTKMEMNAEGANRDFLIGFIVINGCMEHLDHTMKINKRQVKILACQLDDKLPTATPETEDSEDALDNECGTVFTGE